MLFQFIFLLLITQFLCNNFQPVFEVIERENMKSQCDFETYIYHFSLRGKATGIITPLKFMLPIKNPNTSVLCEIKPPRGFNGETSLECVIDGNVHTIDDVEIKEEPPEIPEVKFSRWVNPKNNEHVISNGVHCTGKNKYNYILLALSNNFTFVGCFRDKNNFSFDVVEDRGDFENGQTVFFNMNFMMPDKEMAYCALPYVKGKEKLTVNCAIDYSGEIKIGDSHHSIITKSGDKKELLILGEFSGPFNFDKCKKE